MSFELVLINHKSIFLFKIKMNKELMIYNSKKCHVSIFFLENILV